MGDYVKSTNQKPDTLSEGAKQEVDSEDEIQEGNVHHTAADSQKVSTSHFDCQTVNMSMLKTVSQVSLLLPFPTQTLVFTCLQYKSFENTVEKGGIAHYEQFLLFP